MIRRGEVLCSTTTTTTNKKYQTISFELNILYDPTAMYMALFVLLDKLFLFMMMICIYEKSLFLPDHAFIQLTLVLETV